MVFSDSKILFMASARDISPPVSQQNNMFTITFMSQFTKVSK